MCALRSPCEHMHPALSVIFFTTVSGMGYGLLFLLGVALTIEPRLLARNEILVLLGAGIAYTAAGLLSSMLHLGQPLRAWRAFSQWRSSWLSREGVAALITFLPLGALALLVWTNAGATKLRLCAGLLAATAAATVFCTARIYTSLKTIPAWRNRLVLPGYALFALLGGAAWFAALDSICATREAFVHVDAAIVIAMLGAWAALLKYGYWQFIDAAPPAATAGSATGLGRFGTVRSVEAPHTEENYLTREMGFVVARKHSAQLRVIAVILFAVVPLIAAVLTFIEHPALSAAALLLATAAIVAGTFVERWLFFAEARHVVMLYYGRARSTAD